MSCATRATHPDAIIPDLSQARSARHLHQGRHCLRLWQPLEATLLQEGRRRLLPPAGAMGRYAQGMAARISSRTAPTGGRRSIRRTISSVRPARSATAAIRSTTTSRPRRSPNGMSAARDATAPAARMSARPTRGHHLNPARLDYVHANDTCIQCHSQGRPPGNPIDGKYYDWPVGFHVGLNLSRFLAARGAQARARPPSPISPTAPRTRTACRATISFRA